MWVRAVRNCYYVYKLNEKYRDKLVIADLQAEKHASIIAAKRVQIKQLTGELDSFKIDFEAKEKMIKEF